MTNGARQVQWSSAAFSIRRLNEEELSRPMEGARGPLVIVPAGERGAEALARSLCDGRDGVLEVLREFGAVLLRGFELRTPSQFEVALRALGLEPSDRYPMGLSPRLNVTKHVFTSTEAGPKELIPPHNEMSYLPRRPAWISFFCAVEPGVGGETPVFDCRAILAALPAPLQELLRGKTITYAREFSPDTTYSGGKKWPDAFATEDRAEVERICRRFGTTFRWEPDRRLRTETVVPCVIEHPATGARCINMQPLYWRDTGFRPDMSEGALSMLLGELRLLRRAWRREPRSFVKKGPPLSLRMIRCIQRAAWRNCVIFPWRQGDILLLDNTLAAHGRMRFALPRKILTCFGDMYDLPAMWGNDRDNGGNTRSLTA